jgi:hypothetical protein
VQILGLARRIAEEVVGAPGVAADEEDPVLIPEGAGRQGVEPQVRRCVSIEAEGHAIAEWLIGRCKAGYEWGQMAVLYREHWIGEKFAQVFKKHDVPVDVAKENKNKVNIKRAAEVAAWTSSWIRHALLSPADPYAQSESNHGQR